MELRRIFNIIWKWLWLVGLSVLIAAATSYAASKAATPLYRTKTTMMIGRITQNPDPSTLQLYTSQQLAYTYIQLAKREPILKSAIESLGLDMNWQALAGQVSASVVPQTQLLEITLIDNDPYRAKVLADAVAQEMVRLSPGTANRDSEQAAFAQAQLDDLKKKIADAQDEAIRLRQELDAANSARQIQDLQTQINVLENKISGWQGTYSQLLLSYQGSDVSTLSVLEEAQIPSSPFSPNVMNNVLVASAIGLILALGGALLIEYLDDTIKNPTELSRATNLTHLVSLPFIEGEGYEQKLVAVYQPMSPMVESFRILRTNLQFSALDKPLYTMMMTSPNPSEGKSVALSNLAVVIAQSGRKVILVDTDLRRPTQHKMFNIPNRIGLTDVMLDVISPNADIIRRSRIFKETQRASDSISTGSDRNANIIESLFQVDGKRETGLEAPNPESQNQPRSLSPSQGANNPDTLLDISAYLQETGVENLHLLTTGQLPPNPTELLGSELMGMLILTLKSQADIVLFDTPPTLIFADAAVLSTRVDGVVLMTDMGRTRIGEATRAVEELRRVRANMLGVILNRAGKRKGSYYSYYYYYSSEGERRRKGRSVLPFDLGRFKKKSRKTSPISDSIGTTATED